MSQLFGTAFASKPLSKSVLETGFFDKYHEVSRGPRPPRPIGEERSPCRLLMSPLDHPHAFRPDVAGTVLGSAHGRLHWRRAGSSWPGAAPMDSGRSRSTRPARKTPSRSPRESSPHKLRPPVSRFQGMEPLEHHIATFASNNQQDVHRIASGTRRFTALAGIPAFAGGDPSES